MHTPNRWRINKIRYLSKSKTTPELRPSNVRKKKNIFRYFRSFVQSHSLRLVSLLPDIIVVNAVKRVRNAALFKHLEDSIMDNSAYVEGRKGAKCRTQKHAQRRRLARCRGKATTREIAAGRGKDEKLSAGDEDRGKTKWPRERQRPMEMRYEGKERNTNVGTRGTCRVTGQEDNDLTTKDRGARAVPVR